MDNLKLAQSIVAGCGGKENIKQAWHCITRLRFNLKDEKKADQQAVQALEEVLGAQFQGDQFQVVIGNNVTKVYEGIKGELGDEIITDSEGERKEKKGGNPINILFDTISGIFNPIVGAITAAGLLKGIMALLVVIKVLNPESESYSVLNMISDATFYFLPFLVGVSAAKKFKVNEYLGASLAGILMYPTYMALGAEGAAGSIQFLFLKIPAFNYSSSVLPIILGVLLLSFVYKAIDKYMPAVLKFIATPLLSLLITAPLTLAFIAPLGNYVGVYVAKFFVYLFAVAGPVAGLLMGGVMSVIVITGMHYAFFPTAFESLNSVGYDLLLLPMSLVSNIAQCGASLAVGIKSKNEKTKSVALSSSLSAVFGITEPAIYGVTLRLKKPFYAALIGGGAGGFIYGLFSVKAFVFSIPGVTALPTYIGDGQMNNFIFALVGFVVAFIVAFIMTFVLGFEDDPIPISATGNTEGNPHHTSANTAVQGRGKNIIAPITGEAVSLRTVPDAIFAEETVGKGIAIIPSEGVVKAPFDGTISMIANTKHAIAITSEDGVELLVHIGIDTVAFQGEGFKILVKEGQLVKLGEKLVEFDIDFILSKGAKIISPIIITNSENFLDVLDLPNKMVLAGKDDILIAVK